MACARTAAILAAMLASASPFTYTARNVGFDGGGWVTGLEVHASTGIIYARTDVGGAYRSDDGGFTWTELLPAAAPGFLDAAPGVAP
jgi:hypothetical protein